MIIAIGEILFDIFPQYRRLGGAPFNFAWHLKKAGMPVRFISRVGQDAAGDEILATLKDNGFSLQDIQVDSRLPTGRVNVTTDQAGIPDFKIVRNVAYDNLQADPALLQQIKGAAMIYFGTLTQRTPTGFKAVQDMLDAAGDQTRCLYDINLRPGCYTREIIQTSLHRAHILKLNEDEAGVIRELLNFKGSEDNLMRRIIRDFDLDLICLTRGSAGSDIFSAQGHCRIKPPPLKDVADTVGAGDAYTAILALGYLKKWPASRILNTASDFAASICRIKGALPADDAFYDNLRIMLEEN